MRPTADPGPGGTRSAVVEIVRFEVPSERRDALITGHLDARRAINAVSPPGALWSRLAQLGESRWVEVVAWGSRSVFERALEQSLDDPIARAWFDLAEPGWTIVIGELAAEPGAPPPREGELELVWTDPGTEVPEVVAASQWSLVAETDGRTLIDPSGWVEDERAAVRLTVRGAVDAQAEPAGSLGRGQARETGEIAHAIDAAEERAPSA